MPAFNVRAPAREEMMDDFSIGDERLRQALEELRWVSRWLGGYAATMQALRPVLRPGMKVLDLGTGAADFPERLVRWADERGMDVQVVAVDANPATVRYARTSLRRRLPAYLQARIRVEVADALDLSYDDDHFDVVTASLFLHHFDRPETVQLLREMQRLARRGFIINDLHRHPAAYYGYSALTLLLRTSEMARHDGLISVRRGFRREELRALAAEAGLDAFTIRWHWAFRWVLSTV